MELRQIRVNSNSLRRPVIIHLRLDKFKAYSVALFCHYFCTAWTIFFIEVQESSQFVNNKRLFLYPAKKNNESICSCKGILLGANKKCLDTSKNMYCVYFIFG
jgi:hypothetical protein